jgi:hypothetical protein
VNAATEILLAEFNGNIKQVGAAIAASGVADADYNKTHTTETGAVLANSEGIDAEAVAKLLLQQRAIFKILDNTPLVRTLGLARPSHTTARSSEDFRVSASV